MASYQDSFHTLTPLTTSVGNYRFFDVQALASHCAVASERLPVSIRIMLEAVLRAENGREVTRQDVLALAAYDPATSSEIEVPFKPARVLLQDFTGVPAIVDLAVMRNAMADLGGDPTKINPQIPVDLVVDHSVQVDYFGSAQALSMNSGLEYERNRERYEFLRWGQQAFENFSIVPPNSGICHQVNLEYLGKVVQERDGILFPDSLVGTDSHTPMINGLGVIGWGVGGIEAEAVLLGQPLYMLAPRVVGVKLTGQLPVGTVATDLVLAVTELLRKTGVVGKFVEFFGTGLSSLTVPDRATLSNMAPEYGATMGYFPVDDQTLAYLKATGRSDDLVTLVRDYCVAQGIFRTESSLDPVFEQVIEFDLGAVRPCLAGPKRPQDRIALANMKRAWHASLPASPKDRGFGLDAQAQKIVAQVDLGQGGGCALAHGAVAIAAITSCTNTSNPSVMLAAGLLAKKAVDKGLTSKPWVKTSLAPGSLVVTEYLTRTHLLSSLEQLGFQVVGYGCTTCIGNSGPLIPAVARAVEQDNLVVASVLSGNRNFEGRISPHVKASYLASPPLVVAYALAGTVDIDLTTEPIGTDQQGKPVMLKDIWPTDAEVQALLGQALSASLFLEKYGDIETGNAQWNAIPVSESELYPWSSESTYIQEPPFFAGMSPEVKPFEAIRKARVIALLGDSVTTDHISPAGAIPADSPAGKYLQSKGVKPVDFNSFGSRRGNDQVMTRGTFGNIRLRNQLAPGTEGGVTTYWGDGRVTSIYEAACQYQAAGIPTIVLAGQDYGMGSSRDWAAKGTALLGIKAVIAQSFERIHRSNLVGMGVLPLQFEGNENAQTLGLTGQETYGILFDDRVQPKQRIEVRATSDTGNVRSFHVICRLDSPIEIDYYRNGGILQKVLRSLVTA
jgi:aconitate hydratase